MDDQTTNQHRDDSLTDSGTDLLTDELLTDELLVEEISIDGMCGVY